MCDVISGFEKSSIWWMTSSYKIDERKSPLKLKVHDKLLQKPNLFALILFWQQKLPCPSDNK